MQFAGPLRHSLLCLAVVTSLGCGSDSPTGSRIPVLPAASFVRLQSDAGDYIGGGRTYEYTYANAIIGLAVGGGGISIEIEGDQQWSGEFQGPSASGLLQRGTYTGLTRYPFHDPSKGGLSWSGEGRGCNTLTGSMTVDSVTYVAGNMTTLDLRFEQHCEGHAAALRGTIHWRADDETRPPGPVTPVPAGLWQPPSGSTPSTGTYAYLRSDAGDFIGAGQTLTYAHPATSITVTDHGNRVSIAVNGWSGEFQIMNAISRFQRGYYADLRRWPFHNPVKGGLSWSGNGRGCNTLLGWFAVDRVTYDGSTMTELDLRFEQHCEGETPALRGEIHWRK